MLWPVMLRLAALLTLAHATLFSAGAAAAEPAPGLRVKFDCYVPNHQEDCQALRDSYFSSMTFLTRNDEHPDLIIEVRTLGADTRTMRMVFKFIGTGKAPSLTLIDDVPLAISHEAALVRALVNLQKCTAPYLFMAEPGTTGESSTIQMRFGTPKQGDPNSPDETSGWYQNSSVFGQYSKGDNTYANGTFSSTFNYSDPSWRVKVGASAQYQKIGVKLDGVEEIQELISFGGKALLVRTVHGGWSVAAMATADHAPAQNLDHKLSAGLGVSWDLMPFLDTYDKSLGFYYSMAAVHHDYVAPNIVGKSAYAFLLHELEVYLRWHFNRVDVHASVGGGSVVDNFLFSGVSGDVGVT